MSAKPAFDIGGGAPDGPNDIRGLLGAFELPNGHTLALNGATLDIRVYDATGHHLRTAGRRGSGPGEFRLPELSRGSGDTVLVYDMSLARLTKVDGSGRIAGSEPFVAVGHSASGFAAGLLGEVLGSAGDGSLIVKNWPIVFAGEGPWSSEPFRDSLLLISTRLGSDSYTRIARVDGYELFRSSASAATASPVRFGRRTYVAVSGSRILVAENNSWEIKEFGLDGKVRGLFRVRVPAVIVTPARAEGDRRARFAWVDTSSGIPASSRASQRELVAKFHYAKVFPPISNLFAASDGYLYVEESGDPEATQDLAVLEPTGALLCRLALPSGFRVLSVGATKVLGLVVDQDGLEHLVGYSILRQ